MEVEPVLCMYRHHANIHMVAVSLFLFGAFLTLGNSRGKAL